MRFVCAQGVLGAGVDQRALAEALSTPASFVACDAGTSDAGPYYLGTGTAAFSAGAVRRDLDVILSATRNGGVPVIIGSAGTAGGDAQVRWVLDLVADVAAEQDRSLNVAAVYTEQSTDYVATMFDAGRMTALPGAPPVSRQSIGACAHVVAMVGVEPIQEAIGDGVNLVVAGRCSDAALFAAMPIAAGLPEGLAWHLGKVVECGTMACTAPGPGVLVGTITDDYAQVEAVGDGLSCTPASVAAHALYESADPFSFTESSGRVDISSAVYEPVDERTVRITGSRFERAESLSVRVEAATLVGHATVIVGGVTDPFIVAELDQWLGQVTDAVHAKAAAQLGLRPGSDYRLAVHRYGVDAVSWSAGDRVTCPPAEVGLVVEVLAETQARATAVATVARQPLLHTPVGKWTGGVTTFACLHNPAHLERGPVYEFTMNHVLTPVDLRDVYRVDRLSLGAT